MSRDIYHSISLIQLGTNLGQLQQGLKLVDLTDNDKTRGKALFKDIEQGFERFTGVETITIKPYQPEEENDFKHRSYLGDIEITTHNSQTMKFSLDLRKYNNGKLLLVMSCGADDNIFSQEVSPQNYRQNNKLYKQVADAIFTSLSEASLLSNSYSPIIGLNEASDASGGNLGHQIKYTPYFKARLSAHSNHLRDVLNKASEESPEISLEDDILTVTRQGGHVVKFNSGDDKHHQNLFLVSQALLGKNPQA